MNKTTRDAFAEENLGLVHSCAKRFVGRGMEYDDLYSAGCVGLLKAIDGFDDSRGFRFSTYAVPLILGEIKALFRAGGAIKVSRGLKDLSLKVGREKARYEQEEGREPTLGELAKRLEVSEQEIAEAVQVSYPPISLTAATDSDSDDGNSPAKQLDLPVDHPQDRIAELLSLKGVVDALEEDDRRLIILRYLRRKTQSETANCLGMTQVQVSRREKKILAHLRENLLE